MSWTTHREQPGAHFGLHHEAGHHRFSDLGEGYVLRVDNGVLHFRKAPPATDANATLTLTKAFFLRMVTGGAGAKDLLLSDQTKIDGSKLDLGRFFAMIEKSAGTFPIVTR